MADIQQGDANVKQSIDVNLRVNKRFVSLMKKNFATPNVKDLEHIITNNSVPTTYTNFLNGRDGQPLNVIANDANTTIAHNANIATNTAADKLLTQNKIYRFHYIKLLGKWIEDA